MSIGVLWRNKETEKFNNLKESMKMEKEKRIENLKLLVDKLKKLPELDFLSELKERYPRAKVFLVGGLVRDALLKRESKDIDLVVKGIGLTELAKILSRYGRVIFDLSPKIKVEDLSSQEERRLIKEGFGVIKFQPSGKKEIIDVALPRTDVHQNRSIPIEGIRRDVFAFSQPDLPIKEDLKRRDFTINAIAVDLEKGEIIDPFNGLEDIEKKVVRSVGSPRKRILQEDLSRAFRGLRFSVQLGFSLEKETAEAIKLAFLPSPKSISEYYQKEKNKEVLKKLLTREKKIKKDYKIPPQENLPRCLQVFYDHRVEAVKPVVSPEIISNEFLKSFDADPVKTLKLWDEFGALKVIFPEIEMMKNVPQPKEFHTEGDVYQHTLLALKKVPKNADLRIKLAVLFHDIGKPLTLKTPEKDGTKRIRFDEHAEVGAELTKKILKRLRLPKRIIEPVVWAIKHHMLPLTAKGAELRDSTIEKYFFRPDGWGEILLELAKYDAMASIPLSGKTEMDCYNKLKERVERMRELKEKEAKIAKPFIRGDDLIGLGLKPGPIFAEILDEIRDLQLKGKLKNKQEAIDYLKKHCIKNIE